MFPIIQTIKFTHSTKTIATVSRSSTGTILTNSDNCSPMNLISPILVRLSIKTKSVAKNNNDDHSTIIRHVLKSSLLFEIMSSKHTPSNDAHPKL